MKKRIIITLEVEDTDEFFMSDEFIKNDLECEIACCSNSYEVKDIRIGASAERTGKWVNKQYICGCSAECSQCHERSIGYSIDTGWGFDHHFYKFCPNCGARMK